MIGKELIGLKSEPITIRIEEDTVRKFADAVGVPFENQVPPTYLGSFIGQDIAGFNMAQSGFIHGLQEFTYCMPVAIGDSITITRYIKDVYQKSGKMGKMNFILVETNGCNPIGELVFSCNSTIIQKVG
jgi:hypothetical protein